MKKLTLIPALILLSSCAAHQAEQNVNEKVSREAGVFQQQEIAERSHEIILNHPSLTEKQRNEMKELFGEVFRKSVINRSEIGKLKSVLFKTLFSRENKSAEMKVIKKRLLAANQSKMDIMLDAMDKAVVILGKNTDSKQFEDLFRDLDRADRTER